MQTLEDVGLTEKDDESTQWNTLERLDSEEKISRFIQGAKMNIEDGDCEPNFIFQALATASTARSINQIAKQSGIDRRALCGLFVDSATTADLPEITPKIITEISAAFLAPQPA